MQIVIVGCGKVGRSLTERLNAENWDSDITVIDTNAEKVHAVSDQFDVMGIIGNGTDFDVLEQAGVADADILIAVTASDEVNLLCCVLARRVSDCRTIARVRNPIYSKGRNLIRQELGLAMTINPEHAAAREILRVLRFPTALGVHSFSKGRIELFRFKVPDNSPLIGKALKDVKALQEDGLICAAERGCAITIPDGSFIVEPDDILSAVLTPKNAVPFFKSIGLKISTVHSLMIIGCGEMSFYLAKMALQLGMDVKIIERDRNRCEVLAEHLHKASIIYGDGSDENLLREEGLDDTDALVASTGIDEENIILSLYAKTKVKTRVVTKISHLDFNDLIDSLDLETVVNPKDITAETLLQYVRALNNANGSGVETLYKMFNNRVEALEFNVSVDSPVCNVPLVDLPIKSGTLIAGIYREGKLIIPSGQDVILPADRVIVVTTNFGFDDIGDILRTGGVQ